MSTNAKAAYVTTLSWNGTEVGELQSIAGPAQKVKAVDVTNLDSGGIAEYLATILEPGTITCEGNFTAASGQTGVITDMASKTERTLVITTFSSHTFTATAICIGFTLDFKVADRVTFKGEFQITGGVTYA
jgi:hypothetical protein